MEPPEERVATPHPARHLFSTAGLVVLTIAILGAFAATAYVARNVIQGGGLAAVITAALVDLANDDRQDEDLAPLTVNPLLVAAAKAKADDMAEKGYFAHNSPEGLTSWHWFREVGYSFSYAGENLAVNFSDSEDVERAWMNSPTHRANIMNAKFTEIGIATAVGEYKGEKTVFVVQMFGTPRTVAATEPPRAITSSEDPDEIAIATTEPEPVITPAPSEEAPEQAAAPIPEEETVLARSGDSITRYADPLEALLASPHGLLRTIYMVSALIILIALALLTRMEFARHHIRHVMAAMALLVLMSGLFALGGIYVFTEPIITQVAAPIEALP